MNDGYNIQHFYMKEDVPPMTIASPEISIGLFSKEYDKRYSCWKHGTIKHHETIINTIDNVEEIFCSRCFVEMLKANGVAQVSEIS
jgi:hypothetical protein